MNAIYEYMMLEGEWNVLVDAVKDLITAIEIVDGCEKPLDSDINFLHTSLDVVKNIIDD